MPRRRLELTEESGFQLICGDQGDGVYSIRLSRPDHPDWHMAAGDFLSFHEAMGIPFELGLDERDIYSMREHYQGHSYNDPYLRPGEPTVLVHSTPAESWEPIRREGQLLCWNALKARGALREQEPIGAALGDPEDCRDYIMFGSGVTGELIVSSRQKGRICTDPQADYLDGARLGYGLASMSADVTLPDIARYCDAFYIGGTKVGALFGEAVVFTKKNMPKYFMTMVKQQGGLLAKGWLLGLQFDTLFTDGLYYEISKNAIDMAELIKNGFQKKGYRFFIDSPTNQQFIIMENERIEQLKSKASFSFWEKYDESHTVVRFATSWATRRKDAEELCRII